MYKVPKVPKVPKCQNMVNIYKISNIDYLDKDLALGTLALLALSPGKTSYGCHALHYNKTQAASQTYMQTAHLDMPCHSTKDVFMNLI